MRYLIISQPKAGTYLCSAILKNLGIHQSYMHLSELAYNQYHPKKLKEGKLYPEKFRIDKKLSESVCLVPEDSFAVTHAQCTDVNKELFKDFKKIMLIKEYHDIIKSFKSWLKESGRKKELTPAFLNGIKDLRNWCEVEGIYVLHFNDMVQKNVKKIDGLQIHLFGEIRQNSSEVLEQSLNEDTLTKLSRRK